MKTIGLLGGMSWESTATYYSCLNQGVTHRLGGLHSARILLYSVEFQELVTAMKAGDWDAIARVLVQAARVLEAGGADFFLICTNTMHKLAPQIQDAVSIPLLHIADATALRAKAEGYRRVGLLGTAFTMQEDFYAGRLQKQHGLEVLTPSPADCTLVDEVIFQELCQGRVTEASRAGYLRVIEQLRENGAEAVILGCTEIGMLVGPEHTDLPLLDTTRLHVAAALEMAFAGQDSQA